MQGYFWPVIIAALILGIAYFLLYYFEEFFEFSVSFLWVAGIFAVIYVAAAAFIRWKLPNPLTNGIFTANAQTTETVIPDVVVHE